MSNIKNPLPETYAAFVALRDSLIAGLQKSGLTPEQVTSEFFYISALMAASACTGFGRLSGDQRVVVTNNFITALNDVIARIDQPVDSIDASHARVVRSSRTTKH